MAKRYELPDAAWELVADLFIEAWRGGRPRADGRPRQRRRWLLADRSLLDAASDPAANHEAKASTGFALVV